VLQVDDEDIDVTQINEVDEGGGSVTSSAWIVYVVHNCCQGWHYQSMKVLLELGPKICGHLTDAIACRPPDFRVGIIEDWYYILEDFGKMRG
jgi:hypothetical protein